MRRRSWPAMLVTVSLTAGLIFAFPGGASASTPTAPVPKFGDPVPGAVEGSVAGADAPASSVAAPIAEPVVIAETPVAPVELPTAEDAGVQTFGEADTTPAVVVGDWKDLGDSGIKVAAASNDTATSATRGGKGPKGKKAPVAPKPVETPKPPKNTKPSPTPVPATTPAPTPTPSPTATEGATPQPTPGPTADETPAPTPTPDAQGTAEPTPEPSEEPVPGPGDTVTSDAPGIVDAGVLGDKNAKKAGYDGIVVSLSRSAAEVDAPVAVSVPDRLLTSRYGADYASRIQWVQVPETSAKGRKSKPVPVATAKTGDATVLTPSVGAQPMLLAAVATTTSASGTGSYGATPLKSSSTWDVAEQTGAFTWQYDMAAPDVGVGPAPTVGLSYNSQSVDGETGSTNNQTSAVGEGWDLSASGFVERSYVPCAKDDGATGAVATSGDLCWKTDNATISFAGHSGPLVKDSSSGKWRLQHDDGTRFEHLTGTAQGCPANGTVRRTAGG